MEREGKGRERHCDEDGQDEEEDEEKEDFMGLKLKRGVVVGKSAAPSTPPPTWSFLPSRNQNYDDNGSNSISARRLGANLWEILPHLPSLSRMSNAGSSGLRRHGHHQVSHRGEQKRKGLRIQPVVEEEEAAESESLSQQPGSAGSFHKEIMQSLMRHHRSVDRNGRAIQPVSPASFSSSMEVTPYHPGATPCSSLELKGRVGESSYSLKTSTELLKVLNRIWNLEEQHASHRSLIRAMKGELDNSRARIKDLLKDKQMDRQVIDDLMKQLAEAKLSKKSTEQERAKSALQSIREELEDERKLRKRSEGLHRKLGRELSDVKSSFSKAMGELERERQARLLLEKLCDEFALGIRDYEFSKKDQVDCSDSMVLHMSEAWIDERLQTKDDIVADKLKSDIESFLKSRERRNSLESYQVNGATSAPKNADEEEGESVDSDSNCFELGKPVSDFPEMSRLQARFRQHMARATSSGGKSKRFEGLVRNNSSSVEGERVHPEDALAEEAHSRLALAAGPASPVKKWEARVEKEVSESSRGATLKARLLEARLEGKQRQSHSNASRLRR